MKILIIGFLVFLGWTSLSTYVYVCKIKGLCYEIEPVAVANAVIKKTVVDDTLSRTLVKKQAVIPQALVTFFAFDKSELDASAEVLKYYEESMTYMFHNNDASVNITGHTDAIGSDQYNQELGLKHAKSVQNFFESKGMPSSKIKIESKGEKEPFDVNNSVSGRTKNRRAVITITP